MAAGDGVWPKVKGLSYQRHGAAHDLTWVVFGLCVVLPWAVLGFGGYRVVRRFVKPTATARPPRRSRPRHTRPMSSRRHRRSEPTNVATPLPPR